MNGLVKLPLVSFDLTGAVAFALDCLADLSALGGGARSASVFGPSMLKTTISISDLMCFPSAHFNVFRISLINGKTLKRYL